MGLAVSVSFRSTWTSAGTNWKPNKMGKKTGASMFLNGYLTICKHLWVWSVTPRGQCRLRRLWNPDSTGSVNFSQMHMLVSAPESRTGAGGPSQNHLLRAAQLERVEPSHPLHKRPLERRSQKGRELSQAQAHPRFSGYVLLCGFSQRTPTSANSFSIWQPSPLPFWWST